MARALALVAFTSAALHAAAGAATLLVADGMPPTRDPAWPAAHLPLWWTSWALWSASALTLLATLALLAPPTPLGRLALALGGAGLATDLLSQSLLTLVLPAAPAASAAVVADAGWMGAAVVANGVYTLAVAAAALAARLAGGRRRVFLASLPVVAAGAAVSATAAARSDLQIYAGAALGLAILAWLVATGVDARRESSS